MARRRFVVGAVLIAAACSTNEFTETGEPDAGGSDSGTDATATSDASGDANAATDANVANDAAADATDAADAANAVDAGPAVKGYEVLGEISFAFVAPYSLAVDSANNLYVSEQTDAPDTHTLYLTNRNFTWNVSPGHARILKFDAAGTYLGWIGRGSDFTYGLHAPASTATAVFGDYPGEMMGIRGLEIDANDHLFVLDSRRVQELDAAHAFVRWAGFRFGEGYGWHTAGYPDPKDGPSIGGFTWASTVRVHAGRLWIGNWYWSSPGFSGGLYNTITALDLVTGQGAGWLGGATNLSTNAQTAGYFPVEAGVDGGGFDGGFMPRSEVAHSATPGVFSSPRHFVWRNDKLYVVDDTSDPVLEVFDVNGVKQPGTLKHLAGVGEKPFAVAVDTHGNVIVSDMYTGSVRFFSHDLDANGEFKQVAEWQVDTPSVPNTSYPIIADFAWDSADNLYVSATTKNKVYKIKLTY